MEYGYAVIPSKESYSQMLDKSPILFANNVRQMLEVVLPSALIFLPESFVQSIYTKQWPYDRRILIAVCFCLNLIDIHETVLVEI